MATPGPRPRLEALVQSGRPRDTGTGTSSLADQPPMQSQWRSKNRLGWTYNLFSELKIGANRAGPRLWPFPSPPGAGLGRESGPKSTISGPTSPEQKCKNMMTALSNGNLCAAACSGSGQPQNRKPYQSRERHFKNPMDHKVFGGTLPKQ